MGADPAGIAERESELFWEELNDQGKLESLARAVTIMNLEVTKMKIRIEALCNHGHEGGRMTTSFNQAPSKVRYSDLLNHDPKIMLGKEG